MNAIELNAFQDTGQAAVSSFVPSLTTGTQAPGQGSMVSARLPKDAVVFHRAVPGPRQIPFMTTQNQKYPLTYDATPPWVSVPSCNANKAKPKAWGMGLVTPGIASLNLPPNTPTHLPRTGWIKALQT